mmetsp:Transcript_3970/g.5765  ORF Transcript_3970/g.5765 Transcript_3970/m.5765 type:complete len:206 (+) Transcript_3970:619-1236(+)
MLHSNCYVPPVSSSYPVSPCAVWFPEFPTAQLVFSQYWCLCQFLLLRGSFSKKLLLTFLWERTTLSTCCWGRLSYPPSLSGAKETFGIRQRMQSTAMRQDVKLILQMNQVARVRMLPVCRASSMKITRISASQKIVRHIVLTYMRRVTRPSSSGRFQVWPPWLSLLWDLFPNSWKIQVIPISFTALGRWPRHSPYFCSYFGFLLV